MNESTVHIMYCGVKAIRSTNCAEKYRRRLLYYYYNYPANFLSQLFLEYRSEYWIVAKVDCNYYFWWFCSNVMYRLKKYINGIISIKNLVKFWIERGTHTEKWWLMFWRHLKIKQFILLCNFGLKFQMYKEVMAI